MNIQIHVQRYLVADTKEPERASDVVFLARYRFGQPLNEAFRAPVAVGEPRPGPPTVKFRDEPVIHQWFSVHVPPRSMVHARRDCR